MARILCVEDDPTTAEYIAKGFAEAGFMVDIAADGRDGLFRASDGGYDAIVLDSLAVLSALRAAGVTTPIVMVSALASLDDRLRGLDAGSDDYLVKPFAFAELLARVEAVRRRAGNANANANANANQATRLAFDDLEVDLLSRRVTRGGRRINLQAREFRLLEFLLRHRDRIVTRAMLLEDVWDCHFDPGTNVIDVHVSRLRKKLGAGGAKPLLHTVRGTGYRLGNS